MSDAVINKFGNDGVDKLLSCIVLGLAKLFPHKKAEAKKDEDYFVSILIDNDQYSICPGRKSYQTLDKYSESHAWCVIYHKPYHGTMDEPPGVI